MTKRYYVRGSNYGGELTIGTVTPEFVIYWQDREQDELLEHLMALESGEEAGSEEGYDPDSPDIETDMEYYSSWYEMDDIHHETASSGTELMAFSLDDDNEIDWDKRIDFDPHCLYSREVYTQKEPGEDVEDNSVPVLVFYSSEKGDFGGWVIELDDDEEFDPDLVTVSTAEHDHGETLERLWYDKKEIDCDYDFVDTRGKGYYANVGWFNKRWEDKHLDPETTKEIWDEVWEYYDDELAEKRSRKEEKNIDI